MSRRSRRRTALATGVVTAALIAAGAAAVLPGTASAATTTLPVHTAAVAHQAAAAPIPALELSLIEENPHQVLQPGGPAATVLMKVTNTTGKAVQFTSGNAQFWPAGALTLNDHEVRATFTPVDSAPKLIPTPGGWSKAVSIPARATDTWKVAVQVAKDWPRNDTGFSIETSVLAQNPFVINKQMASFKVGNDRTGGPVVTALSGVTTLSSAHPAVEKLTVTNRTGARIDRTLAYNADALAAGPFRLAVDEWVGSASRGHWQQLDGRAVVLPSGLANGATDTVTLRVRVVSYDATTPSAHAFLSVMSQDTMGYDSSASQPLTVLR